jgi:hypothetical protein
LSSGSPPAANMAAEANVAALDPAPPLAPALMRCEAVDYDTPVLPVNYQAYLVDDPVDDSSVDSAYNAFMASPVVEASPAPLVGPPASSGPWSEVIHSDGEVTLFYGVGADATGYDPAWLAARGQPSTAAALNALAAGSAPATADDSDFILVSPKPTRKSPKKRPPKGRRGQVH